MSGRHVGVSCCPPATAVLVSTWLAPILSVERPAHSAIPQTEIQASRCVDLDVSTRHGNITVFLPPSFNGTIAFRTRRGLKGVSFLPHFAARARVVRGNDRGMLVSLCPTPTAEDIAKAAQPPQAGDDYCVIGTRHGKVVIGIYGLDSEADVIQAGGLAAQFEALMENGAKQIETWFTAGAKALENSLQGRRIAAETLRQTRLAPLQARAQLGSGMPIAGPSSKV